MSSEDRVRLVWQCQNLRALSLLAPESIDLIYMDPLFNTGKRRRGREALSYDDSFPSQKEYLDYLETCFEESWRLLKKHGSIYVHIDPRISHRIRLRLDRVFGHANFMNEIILQAYDYGGRPKDRWPKKHDTILVYAKNLGSHYFCQDDIDRIPYMAPGLAGKEKAARGKLPTDVWWHTIVHTTGSERTGRRPTQKPLGILRRIVQASCPPDGIVLDFFAGSGTTGEAAFFLDRSYILIDHNPQAIDVIMNRLPLSELFIDES